MFERFNYLFSHQFQLVSLQYLHLQFNHIHPLHSYFFTYMLFRVLLFFIKQKCLIISSHAPSSNNICTFYPHFLTSLKTLLGFLPNSLIFLTASSFIDLSTAFLAAFFNLLYSSLVYSVGYSPFLYMLFFLLYLILYLTTSQPHIYITFPVSPIATNFIACNRKPLAQLL